MNLAMSAGFLTATVLLYSWAYGAFRNEKSRIKNSPMSDTLAVAACVALTGLIALFLAFGIAAGVKFGDTIAEMNVVNLGTIAVCAAACWFLPRRILAHTRAGNDNPTGSAPDGTVSNFPKAGHGKSSPARSGKFRKAA